VFTKTFQRKVKINKLRIIEDWQKNQFTPRNDGSRFQRIAVPAKMKRGAV